MRKFFLGLLALMVTASVFAVPAKRGWQTRTQADGTRIEVQQVGDEFYHFWETKDGKIAELQDDGTFIVTNNDVPDGEVIAALRRASKRYVDRRAKKAGAAVMPARGLFILVSFKDRAFGTSNANYYKTRLGDATEGAKSMYNYLKLQSNNKYAPPIDVFGPVIVGQNVSYYGSNGSDGNDKHAAAMVVEACKLLDDDIDFSIYDANNDHIVDNVYVIYAGRGEADGGAANTIWPHQWEIAGEGLSCKLDETSIKTYACSAELNGSDKVAMGTPLHEFSHVLGLPDYYDTEYESTNYSEARTPGEWSLMDAGSYNDDGNTPPNYSIFDKYFLGWDTPKLLANDPLDVTLTTAYSDAYQVNGGTTLLEATNTNTIYYIENRQLSGWDAALPGHGMIVWRVMYNSTRWNNNDLNNYSGTTRLTVLSASGDQTNIGKVTDPFPGNGTTKVTSWNPFAGCSFTEITETNGTITFKYNGGAPADPFTLTWMANGVKIGETTSTGKVVLPENTPEACASGKVFVGWTKQSSVTDGAKPADLFTTGGQAVTEATTYYAVYATQEGEGGAAFDGTTGGTFKIYANVNGTKYYATTVSNSKLQSSTEESKATEFTFTAVEGGFTIKNGTKYIGYGGTSANISSNNSAYTWKMEAGSHGTWRAIASTSTTERALVFRASTYNVFGAYSTGNIDGDEYFDLEIGDEGSATYSDYSLECGAVVVCELTGITLNTDNVKKEFTIGDDFNSNGLTVTAQFSNCAEKNVTDFIVEKPEMAFAGTKTVTVSYTFDGVTKTASYEIEVKEPEVYTIRFFNNGEQVGQDQLITEGQQPEMPAQPEAACEKYTFAGWAKAAVTTETETKPTLVTDFTAIQDQDYFAVFSRTETEEGDPTGASAAFDGQTPGTYKIFGIAGSTTYYAIASINSNAKLETTTTEADAAEFDFEAVNGGFTIKTGGKYLKYNGSSTNIGLGTDPYTWSISASESGKGSWRIIASTATNRALILRVTSTFQSFGAYVTTNVTATGTEYFDVEIEGEGGPKSTTYYTTAPECDDPVVCELLEIELDLTNVQTSFVINEEFNHNGLAVTAHYGNCIDKQITDFEVTAPDDMSSAGEKEVVVSYTENGVTKTQSYFISVTAPQTFTIRFFDNGEQVGQDQLITEGQQPEMPAQPEAACEKYTFAGWATDDVEETTTKPDLVTDFTAIQNQDYFAIFSRTETTEGEGSGAYIIFKTVETDKTAALDPEGIAAFIESESGIDSYYGDRIYEGQYGLKFSTSRYTGSLNIGLVDEITTNTITLETHTYGTDATTFTIKTELDQYTFGEAQTVKDGTMTFTTENPMTFSQLSITTNSKKRAYIKSITIGEGGASSTTYYTSFENCSEEAIEEIVSGNKAVKVLENGMIIIIRDGAQYTIFGQKIK